MEGIDDMTQASCDTTGAVSNRRRRTAWSAYAACAAALGYALPHLWWGLGIPLAFPGDFSDTPTQPWMHALAFWGMGALAVFGASFALALVKPWGRNFPRRLLLVPAWVASVGLTLWGLGYFYLRYFLAVGRVVPAPEFAAQDAHPAAVWGFYWYAVFLVWGLSLGIAAWTTQTGTAYDSRKIAR
jgi:hypothetical protein